MFCSQCGHENTSGAKYCVQCGRPLAAPTSVRKAALAVCLLVLFLCSVLAGLVIFRNTSAKATVSAPAPDAPAAEQMPFVEDTPDIIQVFAMEDGSVAAVYSDGKVIVAGNDSFAKKVGNWENVTQLWGITSYDDPFLVGLTADGTVLTTRPDLDVSEWKNIEKLYVIGEDITGVTRNGNVLTNMKEEIGSLLASQTNVKELVYSPIEGIYGCLKRDGTVYLLSEYTDPDEVKWSNVKELRTSGHAFYCILNDGSVTGGVDHDAPGLKGAAIVDSYQDWLFGVSPDGRLLTYNGGNIYTNTGAFHVAAPGSSDYSGEVDIRQYDQIKDLLAFGGLILLNRDGTVEAITDEYNWDFTEFSHIEKIYGYWDWDNLSSTIYGIREDGSVITTTYYQKTGRQSTENPYRDWKLQKMDITFGGVVGLTTDGKLVGNGIYNGLDFSAFDR